jgi:hypothetical protein
MYVSAGWRVPEGLVAQLLALSTTLDLRPGPGGSRGSHYRETQALYEPVLGPLFPGTWTQATIFALYPSSQLVGHRDAPIRGIRQHLPLTMNDGCWVFHEGVWQQLAVGEVYHMDPTGCHGAVNWGETRRLHLVIDRQI